VRREDGEKNMFIRTERLFLRPAWPEDIDELTQVLADDAVCGDVALAPLERTSAQLRAYFDSAEERRLPRFFINVRDDNGSKLIGSIGLGRSGSDIELGYWIARMHRGRGYASEAVRAVLAQARALGHRRVVAAQFAENEAAARVLEHAGFQPTNETRSRFSAYLGTEAPARLYVASLADKLFDFMGVGSQAARA
jgi:RimJ/RimL family protein N-acetyltransferase